MKGCDLQDAMDRMSVPTRVDEALMRRVCGNYATGVAIVSTMSATDQPVALTVNSFSSVRSEEHTSELQSLMRISYAAFCLKKKTKTLHPYRNGPQQNHSTTVAKSLPTST